VRGKKRPNPIGRGTELFDDLLHLLNGLPGFQHHVFLFGNLRAELEEFTACGVAWRQGGDEAVQPLDKAMDWSRGLKSNDCSSITLLRA
jgi:hypothetical protein